MDKYMISYIFLGCGGVLLLVVVFYLLFKYLSYRSVINENVNGYDVCKRVIDNKKIAGVNIVEARDGRVNIYSMSRRVIRLNSSNYYNRNCFSLGVSAFLGGVCVLDDEGNSNIRNISKVFSSIGYIDISSVITIIVSYLFTGYYAVVGVILLGLIFVYQYFRKGISNDCVDIVNKDIMDMEELGDEMKKGVISCINGFNFVYNVSLIITILQICRLFIYMI